MNTQIEGAIGSLYNSFAQEQGFQGNADPLCEQDSNGYWNCMLRIGNEEYKGYSQSKKGAIMQVRKRFMQSNEQFWSGFVREMLMVDFYNFGQNLNAPEDQFIEFKGGSLNTQAWSYHTFKDSLKAQLGRFVCAALNDKVSRRNYYIFFGVHDDGTVQGIDMTGQINYRDQASLIWEEGIQNKFYPLPIQESIQYQFIPVQNEEGIESYVMKFTIQRGDQKSLFWYDDTPYQRLGASTQKMKALTIENRIVESTNLNTRQHLKPLVKALNNLLLK